MKMRSIVSLSLGLALALMVGCSSDDGPPEELTNPTPNNDGVVDEVPMCVSEIRDYASLDARYPFAGEGRFYRLDDTFCPTTGSVLLEVDDSAPKFDAPIAMISPHAGWQYSGIVTAQMLSQIDVPDLVYVIGNNHKNKGEKFAVYPEGDWAFPFGDIPVDAARAAEMVEGVDALVADTVAHSEEHSAEVQMVWLHAFNPNVRVVPIAIDNSNDVDELLDLGSAIGEVLKGVDEPFFVVMTTDLTHYETSDVVQERDDLMVEKMVAFDHEGLFELVSPQRSTLSMCGMEPVVVGMQVAKTLGATEAELVMRRKSSDKNGNEENAVGYAGVMLY